MLAYDSHDDLPEESPLLRELLEMRARREVPTRKELRAVRIPPESADSTTKSAELRDLTEVVVVQSSDPRIEE